MLSSYINFEYIILAPPKLLVKISHCVEEKWLGSLTWNLLHKPICFQLQGLTGIRINY